MKNPIPIVDGHSDILIDVIWRYKQGEEAPLGEYHLPRLKRGNVTMEICPISCDDPGWLSTDTLEVFRYLDILREEMEKTEGRAQIAESASDFQLFQQEEPITFVLGLEGGKPLAGDRRILRIFYRLGLRWVQLTWNDQNRLGCGAGVENDGGLTEKGEGIIEEMNELGMVLDMSHSSKNTFWDAADVYRGPIVVSHSNPASLCPHRRNLTDRQIEKVAEREGIVGINFYPRLVSESPPAMDDVINHIKYVAELTSIDNVSLGPDFIDYMPNFKKENLISSDVDYGDSIRYPEGLEKVTQLPNLIEGLKDEGFSDRDIKKVAGENILRVYREVLKD